MILSPQKTTFPGFCLTCALLLLLAAQLTISARAQSTNWTSGINFLNVPYGLTTDTDVVDNATLMVTNGGSLIAGQLLVGPTNAATLILSNNASITVAQLLVTNNSFGVTNSILTLSGGGTLTTSNYNDLAAAIYVASNQSYTISANWTMNGGTNLITTPPGVTNSGNIAPSVNLYANGGVTMAVNSNAVLQLGAGYTTTPNTNGNLVLIVGSSGGLTNNLLIVNDGLVTNVQTITIGNVSGATNNQMIITNGGQVFQSGNTNSSYNTFIGNSVGNVHNNSLVIWGADSSGRKSRFDLGNNGSINGGRLSIGGSQSDTGDSVVVGPSGVVTNGAVLSFGVNCTALITNGGRMDLNGGLLWGRGSAGTPASNDTITVVGADSSGNLATLNLMNNSLQIAGSGVYPNGKNSSLWIMQNGLGTNAGTVAVGGGGNNDTNEVGNGIIITNGGQLFGTGVATIGYGTNCYNNYVYVGGAFGSTNALWYLGNTLKIGDAGGYLSTFSTNNTLTVAAGGVVTNISTLTVGSGDLTATNNGVTVGGGRLYATTVIVNTNNYLTITNGGTLTASIGLNGLLTVDNGTLTPTASGNWITNGGAGSITLGAGGMTNNTSTFTVTNSVAIGGAGSLTKIGTGNLALTSANTYNGNTILSTGEIDLGSSSALGTGTVTVNGGTTLASITSARTLANNFIIGGNFQFGGRAQASTVNGSVNLNGGTPTITLGNSLTIGGVVSNGGFTLASSNPARSLTLTNVNTYTGPTVVNGGGLYVNSPGSLASSTVTAANNTILGGSGTINGTVTVGSLAMLVPGGLGTIGILTLANSGAAALTLNGSLLPFDLNNPTTAGTTYDQIAITGSLVLNGANSIQLNAATGTITNGTYTLMTYASKSGSGTLTFPNGSTTIGNLTLTVGSTSVTLTVSSDTASPFLTWNGNVNGTWDISTTANWLAGAVASTYTDGNMVTFDDTLSGSSTVTNIGPTIISPGSVIFNNNNTNYSISAIIAGSGSLTKLGTGAVTLGGGSGAVPIVATGLAGTTTNVLTVTSTAGISVGQTLFNPNTNGVGLGNGVAAVGFALITNLTATTIGINTLATNFNNTTVFVQGNTYTGGTTVNGGTLNLNCTAGITNGVLASSPTGAGNLTLWNGSSISNLNGAYYLAATQATVTNANSSNGNIYLTSPNRVHVSVNTLDLGHAIQTFWLNNFVNGIRQITNASSLTPFMAGSETTGSSEWEITTGPNGSGVTVQNGVMDLETTATAGSAGTNYYAFQFTAVPNFINASLIVGTNVLLWGSGSGASTMPLTINKGGIWDMYNGSKSIASLSDGTLGGGSVYAELTTNAGVAVILTINNNTVTVTTNTFSGNIGNGPTSGFGTAVLSLTKASSSTQILAGTNTYTGSTTINGGELIGVTTGSCSNSPVTVTNGAIMGVQLAAANSQWVCAGLTNNAGSTVDFNFSNNAPSTTTAPLLVNGNVAFSNANIIVRNLSGNTLAAGDYPLIKYTGTASGAYVPATLTLPGTLGGFITNNTGNNSLDLVILSGGSLVWATNSGNWDIQTTGNWQVGGVFPFTYSDGEPVTFDDTANSGGNTSILVTNAVTVSPLSVTANNSSDNYTIYGSPIAGVGGLTKSGTGTLSLNNTNSYAGVTVVNAGTLAANNSLALGTNKLTLNGGTLSNSTPVVGTVINMTNAINLASASTLGIAAGVTNVYWGASGSITNTGALTQVGGGTLVIENGQAKFSGGYTLNSGELDLLTSTLGTGPITVNSGIFADLVVSRSLTNSVFNFGGSFQFGGATSGLGAVNSIALVCPVNVGTSAKILTLANSLFIGGTVTNTGNLTVIGGGQNLSFTNYSGVANTFSGGLTVSNVILNIFNQGSLGSGAVTVTNRASLNNLSSPAGIFAVTNAFNVNGALTYLGTAASLVLAAPVTLAGNEVMTVTNTLTISNAISDGGHAYALTKSGPGTLVLDGLNTYSGNTTNNASGILQVGNNDNLGSIPGSIFLNGGSLAYNLTNNYTQAGVIASSSGNSGITNSGTYATATNTLTLADGFNLFTNIAVTSGTLILNGSVNSTNYFTVSTNTGSIVGSALVPSAGATIQLNGGNYILTNGNSSVGGGSLIVNGGSIYSFTNNAGETVGNGFDAFNAPGVTNLTLNSGLIKMHDNGLFLAVNNQTFNLNGGTLYLDPTAMRGLRLGNAGGSTGGGINVNFTGTQTGGTLAMSASLNAGGTHGFDLGGTNFANTVATYTLSGGLLEMTNNNGSASTIFTMAAPTNSGNTALTEFTLNGTGGLLVNGNIANAVGTGAANNPNVVFAFDGGTFACDTFNAYALRSDVSGGAFGVLTNNGGTLAPGFTNNAGTMTINGSYVQSTSGTLDVDIGGATAASGFLTYPSPAGYDQLAVTNQTTLNGTLVVRTNGAYSPPATGSYTVVTNYVTGSGLSATLTNIYNNSVAVLGGLGYSFQVVTNANTLVLTNFSPLTVAWVVGNTTAPINTVVTFTNNNSAGAITNWVVDYGDGSPTFSYAVSPNGTLGSIGTTHTYSTAGVYTATNTLYASDGATAKTTQVITAQTTGPTTGTNITFTVTGNTLNLSWPTNYIGWELQSNALDLTVSNDWYLVPDSTATNSVFITIDPTQPNVFYRMLHP